MAVVGHLCLSTEGIPSPRRGPRPLSPVYPMHPFLCFTGFKLVFFFFFCILLYISISLCLSPSPPFLFARHPSEPLRPFLFPPYLCTPPPQAKQCSELSHHTNGTNVKHTNQLQLTLGSSSEQESMALVPSRKRKAGTLQTNQPTKQRKTPERKNVLCLFTFWYTSHQHLVVKLFLSLKI